MYPSRQPLNSRPLMEIGQNPTRTTSKGRGGNRGGCPAHDEYSVLIRRAKSSSMSKKTVSPMQEIEGKWRRHTELMTSRLFLSSNPRADWWILANSAPFGSPSTPHNPNVEIRSHAGDIHSSMTDTPCLHCLIDWKFSFSQDRRPITKQHFLLA